MAHTYGIDSKVLVLPCSENVSKDSGYHTLALLWLCSSPGIAQSVRLVYGVVGIF